MLKNTEHAEFSWLFRASLHVPLPQYKEALPSSECGNNAKLWHQAFINHLYLQAETNKKNQPNKPPKPQWGNHLLQAIQQSNEWCGKYPEIQTLLSQVNTYPVDHAGSVRSQVHFVFEACYPLPLKELLLVKYKSNTSKINQTHQGFEPDPKRSW